MKSRRLSIALTMAGSDSGGGAGLQADLRTFASLGVHGVCAVTALTAQNPVEVPSVWPAPAAAVRAQLEAVWAELAPAAAKTGMLARAGVVREVADFFKGLGAPQTPLVIDPVMVSTSGAELLDTAGRRAAQERLFPLATLLTPNLAEAGVLLGRAISGPDAMARAAADLEARYGAAILLKGGHAGGARSRDLLRWRGRDSWLSAPRISGVAGHGTGCVLSAAITAGLALGLPLPAAVGLGKRTVTRALRRAAPVARHWVLTP